MRIVISLIVLFLALTACTAEAPTRGEVFAWTDELCSEELDGQRRAFEGYFSFRAGFREEENGTAYIEMRESLDEESKFVLIALPIGEDAGEVKAPPIVYGLDDLEVRSSAGEVLRYGDAARISFTIKYNTPADGEPWCRFGAPFLIETLDGDDTGEATEASE